MIGQFGRPINHRHPRTILFGLAFMHRYWLTALSSGKGGNNLMQTILLMVVVSLIEYRRRLHLCRGFFC